MRSFALPKLPTRSRSRYRIGIHPRSSSPPWRQNRARHNQIAAAVAQDDISIYSFDGKKESDNADLHITSTKFDEPMALALVARSEYCVTVHGAAGSGVIVFLCGLHDELKSLLRDRLTEAGFEPAESDDPELQGTNPCNICNRGASGAGVQLEIMRGLRDALTDQTDPQAPDRLAAFAGVVRGAIEANNHAWVAV